MYRFRSLYVALIVIASFAQPIHTESKSSTLKKGARIAIHTAQTAAGLYIAYTALAAYRAWPSYCGNKILDSHASDRSESQQNRDIGYEKIRRIIREEFVPRMAAGCAISIPTLLYHGIAGLSKELHWNLPSWTPSLSTSTKKYLEPLRKIIKIAFHCAQLGICAGSISSYFALQDDARRTAFDNAIITDFGGLDHAMDLTSYWHARYYDEVALERLSEGSKITIPLQTFVTSQLAWYGAKGLKQELLPIINWIRRKNTNEKN